MGGGGTTKLLLHQIDYPMSTSKSDKSGNSTWNHRHYEILSHSGILGNQLFNTSVDLIKLPDLLLLLLLLLNRKSSDNTLHHPTTTLSLSGELLQNKNLKLERLNSAYWYKDLSVFFPLQNHIPEISCKNSFLVAVQELMDTESCACLCLHAVMWKAGPFLGAGGGFSFYGFFECLKECCFSHESSHPTQEDGRMPNFE